MSEPKITTPNRADYWSAPWRLNAHDSTKATWFSPILIDLQNAKREVVSLGAINDDLLTALEGIKAQAQGWRDPNGPSRLEVLDDIDSIAEAAIAKAKLPA